MRNGKQVHVWIHEAIWDALVATMKERQSNPATARDGRKAKLIEEALLMHPEVAAHLQMEQEAA